MKCQKCFSRVGVTNYEIDDESFWLCLNCADDFRNLIDEWIKE